MSIINKMNKRFLGIIAVIVAMFVLAACGESSAALAARRKATEDVQELVDSIVLNGGVKDVYNNLTGLAKDAKNNIKVSWVSSDTSLVNFVANGTTYTGEVTRPENEAGDKDVTLTATATLDYSYIGKDDLNVTKTVTATKIFELTVKAKPVEKGTTTIEQIKTEVADDAEVVIQGIVTGTFDGTHGGFFVSDETGSIYVFKTFTDEELKLGDEVKVYGNKGKYYGAPQIAAISGSSVSFTVLSHGNALPTPAETTIDTVATFDKTSEILPGTRYESYALLIKQQDGANQNYYLVDPYTGNKIQIYYRTYDATTTNLQQYIDKYVNIVYSVYYYDTRISMWSVDYTEFAGSIEETTAPVLSDQQKAELVEQDVAKLFGDFTTTSTLTLALPTVNTAYAGTITWEALDANATVAVADTTATVTWGVVTADTEVKVKATFVVGSYSFEKEYTVTVKPMVTLTVAQFIDLGVGQYAMVKGILYKLSNGNFYLVGNDGKAIFMYGYKGALNHGDEVLVYAKRDAYNNLPELASAVIQGNVLSTGNALPLVVTPTTVEAVTTSAFPGANLFGQYLEVQGTVKVDPTDARYLVLEDNGKTLSFYYSDTTKLNELLNKRVTVRVLFYSNSKADGSGVWRVCYTGYEGEYALPELTNAEKLAAAGANLPVANNQELFGNVTLPAAGDYATTIAWTSDNAALDAATGVITQGETDVTVTLTAVLTLGEDTLTVTRTVIVKALAAPLTVSEFLALPVDQTARVRGYIYEYADGSYLVGEDGKAVLVYKFKAANHGDLVVVSGKRAAFQGTAQMGSGATLVKTESTGNTLPLTAAPMAIADIVALDYATTTLFNSYISVTGTVVADGSFYALSNGTQKISFYYSNNTVLAALLNKEVTLQGFLYGISKTDGTGVFRMVFNGLDGEYPALTSAEKIALAKAKVTLTEGQEVTANLTLLAAGDFSVTVTWTSDNAAIDATTGVVTRPANGSGDANVKLTATFTVDEATEVVEYNVVVKEQAPVGTEEALVYSTGFEAPDFLAGTTYNGATPKPAGPADKQWNFVYGTPSTTAPIAETQSAQMRWYASAPTTFGYIETNFTIDNVTKVVFKAANTSTINVKVSYSTDGGTTYSGEQIFELTATVAEYTYTINATGSVKLKFEINFVTAPTDKARLYIDDVKIWAK